MMSAKAFDKQINFYAAVIMFLGLCLIGVDLMFDYEWSLNYIPVILVTMGILIIFASIITYASLLVAMWKQRSQITLLWANMKHKVYDTDTLYRLSAVTTVILITLMVVLYFVPWSWVLITLAIVAILGIAVEATIAYRTSKNEKV